jgi:hypothetical protein
VPHLLVAWPARAGRSTGLGRGSGIGWKQGTRRRGPAAAHGQHRPTCLRADARATAAASWLAAAASAQGSARRTLPWPGRGMGEERVRRERKRDPVRTGNRCPSRLRSGSEARRGVVRRRGGGGVYVYIYKGGSVGGSCQVRRGSCSGRAREIAARRIARDNIKQRRS